MYLLQFISAIRFLLNEIFLLKKILIPYCEVTIQKFIFLLKENEFLIQVSFVTSHRKTKLLSNYVKYPYVNFDQHSSVKFIFH